jgi:hypothetical protein
MLAVTALNIQNLDTINYIERTVEVEGAVLGLHSSCGFRVGSICGRESEVYIWASILTVLTIFL